MIISTKEIKKYIPIDLSEGDILINENLYGMIKGYNKVNKNIKKKIEKKILNAYKCTYKCNLKLEEIEKLNKIRKITKKYSNMAVLTSEEVKKELDVEISSEGLLIAVKKEIDRPIDITEEDIKNEITTVKRLMEQYKDEALNVIKNALSERKELAKYYRNLLYKHEVDGEVYCDKITKFYLHKPNNYKCVYDGVIYAVYVVKSIYCAETKRGYDLKIKWGDKKMLPLNIIDKEKVKYGRYPTNIYEILKIAKKLKYCNFIHEDIVCRYKDSSLYHLGENKNGKIILTVTTSKYDTYIYCRESKDTLWYKPVEFILK